MTTRSGSSRGVPGQIDEKKVAELPLKRVTDAETSSDGAWVTVRNGEEVAFYRAADVARPELLIDHAQGAVSA